MTKRILTPYPTGEIVSKRKVSKLLAGAGALWIVIALAFVSLSASPSLAQDEEEHGTTEEETVDPEQQALDELIREGANVYAAQCQSCHQPGGAGLEGSFPPLKGNERTTNADYVREVVVDGKSGPLEVAGVTYDGAMPSFSTLTDAEIDSVVAYVAADLVIPESVVAEFEPASAASGSGLSPLVILGALVGLGVLVAAVNSPRLISINDRLDTDWFAVGLKAFTMVVGIVLLTVFIPNWAMQNASVARMSRPMQDLIGTGLWSGGFAVVLGGMWWAHRDSRI